MKRTIQMTMAGIALALVLSACPPAFEPELNNSPSWQRASTERYYFTVAASGNTLTLQPDNNYTAQEITITTTAVEVDPSIPANAAEFNLYIDPKVKTNNIPGVGLYPVTNGTENAATPIGINKDSPLTYTAVYSGRNKVLLTFPFNEAIKKTKVALVVDPAEASFNGSANHRLNMDENTEYGTPDDIFIQYYDVTGNPGVTPPIDAPPEGEPTGYYQLPPYTTVTASFIDLSLPTVDVNAPPLTERLTEVNGNKIVIYGLLDTTPGNASAHHPGTAAGTADGPKADNFDKGIISSAYKFQRFDYAAKKWVDEPFTVSDIDTTNYTNGAFEVTFTRKAAAYDLYRYAVDPYKIVEKNPVLGYYHRVSYDSSLGFSRWDNTASEWKRGEWAYLNSMPNYNDANVADQYYHQFSAADFAAVGAEGIQGRYFLIVEIEESNITDVVSGSLYFDRNTINAKNIQVVREYGETGDDRKALWPIKDADFEVIDKGKFRIYAPADYVQTQGDVFSIYINNVKVHYKTQPGGPGTSVKSFDDVVLAGHRANGAIELSYTMP
jgi:hypothetical protein